MKKPTLSFERTILIVIIAREAYLSSLYYREPIYYELKDGTMAKTEQGKQNMIYLRVNNLNHAFLFDISFSTAFHTTPKTLLKAASIFEKVMKLHS